ncbi:YceD family protein [Haloferula sargassicola]|uniref:DUF177 domain-containing protein n=1 Tax=Haloferula sargassicola TaxID=490096 RepID=A0ABP9UKV1_9BACT
MKKKLLLIDLATLPDEGQPLSGELPAEIFDLPEDDDAKAVGPLEFDLHVQRFGSELLLTGRISAPFEFTCVRTIHPFIQTIEVDPAAISMEITEGEEIDATEAVREEILINLPADPRCENADEPQECEIDPRYLAVDKPAGDTVETRPRAEGDDRWAALDALKNTDSDR